MAIFVSLFLLIRYEGTGASPFSEFRTSHARLTSGGSMIPAMPGRSYQPFAPYGNPYMELTLAHGSSPEDFHHTLNRWSQALKIRVMVSYWPILRLPAVSVHFRLVISGLRYGGTTFYLTTIN